jgi:Bacterial regulatory helix-turn-helix protein, lysR family
MDLRQFRYFVAVAEERNITRAAERLGLQPPPLSRQIKAIEREINIQLSMSFLAQTQIVNSNVGSVASVTTD